MKKDIDNLVPRANEIDDPRIRDLALALASCVRANISAITMYEYGNEIRPSIDEITQRVTEFVMSVKVSPELETILEAATHFARTIHLVYGDAGFAVHPELIRDGQTLAHETVELVDQLEQLDEDTRDFWLGCPLPSAGLLLGVTLENMDGKESVERAKSVRQFNLSMVAWLQKKVYETSGSLNEKYSRTLSAWQKILEQEEF